MLGAKTLVLFAMCSVSALVAHGTHQPTIIDGFLELPKIIRAGPCPDIPTVPDFDIQNMAQGEFYVIARSYDPYNAPVDCSKWTFIADSEDSDNVCRVTGSRAIQHTDGSEVLDTMVNFLLTDVSEPSKWVTTFRKYMETCA